MIGEKPKDEKLHVDPYLYDIGDEVIAINPHIAGSELHDDGIDYHAPQVISAEFEKDLGDMIVQIIYFKSNPTEPHIACWFEPYGETKERYKDVIAEVKQAVAKIKPKGKSKPNIDMLKKSLRG